MASPYELFKTDRSLEQKGIIVNYGDFRFRVARAGGANVEYQKALAAKMRPFRFRLQSGTMTNEDAQNILVEAFVDGVLLGWDGVTDENGNEVEFSRENAIRLFTDLPELFKDLQQQATEVANFRAGVTEETVKN